MNNITFNLFKANPCALKPCKNGGKCKSSRTTFKCICMGRSYGKRCEKGKLLFTIFNNVTHEKSILTQTFKNIHTHELIYTHRYAHQ